MSAQELTLSAKQLVKIGHGVAIAEARAALTGWQAFDQSETVQLARTIADGVVDEQAQAIRDIIDESWSRIRGVEQVRG